MTKQWITGLALAAVLGVAGTATRAHAQAIITDGSGVYLGVNPEGHLNVPNGSSGVTLVSTNSDAIGLYYLPVMGDATAPGCLCEGWGVGINGTTVGYADIDSGGVVNLTVDSFGSTPSTATSMVHLTDTPGLTVTQAYAPSSVPGLFQDTVTITNMTGGDVTQLRYERAMDWDIPPTTFDEYVTVGGWPATNLIHSEDNGFQIPNVYSLSGEEGCAPAGTTLNQNFVDSGPCDHGADFVFDFGTLANGGKQTFDIFYGAAPNEASAFAALAGVGAEVYSLGQQNGDPTGGTPATFIWGFKGVGGTVVVPPTVPEPASMLLLGTGLLGLVRYRRRRV
jgi:type IV pilus assembly protein PilY1